MDQKFKQDMEIGSTIRSLRMERHLTQEQVVSKLQLMDLDITRSIYSQIEGGTYSIRISVLVGLAKLFRVDFNTFFRNIPLPDTAQEPLPSVFFFPKDTFPEKCHKFFLILHKTGRVLRLCRKCPHDKIGIVKIICREDAGIPGGSLPLGNGCVFSRMERRLLFHNFILYPFTEAVRIDRAAFAL